MTAVSGHVVRKVGRQSFASAGWITFAWASCLIRSWKVTFSHFSSLRARSYIDCVAAYRDPKHLISQFVNHRYVAWYLELMADVIMKQMPSKVNVQQAEVFASHTLNRDAPHLDLLARACSARPQHNCKSEDVFIT